MTSRHVHEHDSEAPGHGLPGFRSVRALVSVQSDWSHSRLDGAKRRLSSVLPPVPRMRRHSLGP